MVFHCFNLHFPDDMWHAASSYMLIFHLYVCSGKVSVQVLWTYFNSGCLFSYCCVLSILCIFWITVLYQMRLLQTCSPSLAYLLVHITLSFREQTFLIFMKASLSMTSFKNHVFGIISKKSLPYQRLSVISPLLPSMSFIVLYFTLRSMIC